jgi:hypothetical protein
VKREAVTEPDIDAMASEWIGDADASEQNGGREPSVRSIEEIPNLEDVSSAPIEWATDRLLPMAAVTLMSSESGDGKSTLLSKAGYYISRGLPFLGRDCTQHPVLYLDCENSHSVVLERFQRLHIQTHADFHYWGQWLPDGPPSAGGTIVWEWIARCSVKPIIIVDSLIGFHPGAENDNSETRRYMSQYRKLASAGAVVVLLHHCGKGENTKEYRGASDIKASVDIAYHLVNLSDDGTLGTLRLKAFKMRFSATPELVCQYVNGEFVVDDRGGAPTVTESLGALLKANPGIRAAAFENLAAEKNLGRNRARQFLQNGLATRTVSMISGGGNTKTFYWGESCPSLI